MKCPICNNEQYEQLLSLPCGNLDGSFLYDTVVVVACKNCGHISNLLSEEEMIGIMKYYEAEYSPSNMQSPNKEGDIPGSSSKNSIHRYSLLFDFIKPYLEKTDKILDIGCAMGGLLHFLKEKQYEQLYGIDFSNMYVAEAQKNEGLKIKRGTAESIPFDETFDFLVADQVVEHLFDPNKIFIEAKRVLKKNGYICISVPNAMLYLENYFFDFYWFLMREHVQHFDAEHLIVLAKRHGFIVEDIINTSPCFLSKETTLPNMSIIFKYTGKCEECVAGFSLKQKTQLYIQQCYEGLERQKRLMDKICKMNLFLYVWGMSREFLYLYNNAGLKYCCISGLIDDIPIKQLCTVDGMKIVSSKIVRELSEESIILITAYAHKEVMINKLKELGYKGKVLDTEV